MTIRQTETDEIRDTILDEIHETRRRIAERFGGDIAAIAEDARRRQEASGRPIWQPRNSRSTQPPATS